MRKVQKMAVVMDQSVVRTMELKIHGGSTDDLKFVIYDARNSLDDRFVCNCQATKRCRHINFAQYLVNCANEGSLEHMNFDEKPSSQSGNGGVVSLPDKAAELLNNGI